MMLNYNDEVMKREQFRDMLREAHGDRLETHLGSTRRVRSLFYAGALNRLGSWMVVAGRSLQMHTEKRSASA